jgi:hypothetical protein
MYATSGRSPDNWRRVITMTERERSNRRKMPARELVSRLPLAHYLLAYGSNDVCLYRIISGPAMSVIDPPLSPAEELYMKLLARSRRFN